MRRLLLLVLMLALPLQWSWAVAARSCEHEAAASSVHFGHHAHEHVGLQAGDDASVGEAPSADHDDCGVCHGAGTPLRIDVDGLPPPHAAGVAFAVYRAEVPGRTLAPLLRPPLTPVA